MPSVTYFFEDAGWVTVLFYGGILFLAVAYIVTAVRDWWQSRVK